MEKVNIVLLVSTINIKLETLYAGNVRKISLVRGSWKIATNGLQLQEVGDFLPQMLMRRTNV